MENQQSWAMGLPRCPLSEHLWAGITAPLPEGQAGSSQELPAQAGTEEMLGWGRAERSCRRVRQGHRGLGHGRTASRRWHFGFGERRGAGTALPRSLRAAVRPAARALGLPGQGKV